MASGTLANRIGLDLPCTNGVGVMDKPNALLWLAST